MKKIDVHVHCIGWKNPISGSENCAPTPDELRISYKELNVEKGILLPEVNPECMYMLQSNEEAEFLSNNNKDLLYWCCNIDPRMGDNSSKTDFSNYLNLCKKRGAVGVGEICVNMWADDPLMENLFYHCAESDMPVIIHIGHKQYDCYGIIDDLGLPRLEKILKKYPKLKILGHSQCFWSEISDDVTVDNRYTNPQGKANGGRIVELMRECPNLYCDLSANSGYNAMTRDPDFTYRFFEEFSDRIMYGSDICRPFQERPLSAWLDESYEKGYLSEKNYGKICRENAIRIFKLNEDF